MTIDERIERLTARHEGLAQSVEMLRDTVHETSAAVERVSENVDRLTGLIGPMLGAMKTLAETATDHEHRVTRLEDQA